MDISTPHLKPSMSANRMSAVDVSQLDKINAIPNKTTNNVLLDGLCQEDQLYLNAMMDEESTDSEDDLVGASSAWSPAMAERPRMNKKRIKRIKPSYVITMSLEDISYIRPSWGMSKGIKKIDPSAKIKKKTGQQVGRREKLKGQSKATTSVTENEESRETLKSEANDSAANTSKLLVVANSIFNTYNLSLAALMFVLSFLMILSYYVELAKQHERTLRLGIEMHAQERAFDILKFRDGQLVSGQKLRVHYGRGIPGNLKSAECTCRMYHAETRKYIPKAAARANDDGDDYDENLEQGKCFACFDWAMRANLQVLVNKSELYDDDGDDLDDLDNDNSENSLDDDENPRDESTTREAGINQAIPPAPLDEDLSVICYDVRWQSYDSLRTPLVDCIHLNEGDQWFGLGDTLSSGPTVWPIDKFNQDSNYHQLTPLISNLSGEFASSASSFLLDSTTQAFQYAKASSTSESTIVEAQSSKPELIMGSYVDFQLISSSGFYVGNLKSDFQASIQISSERREICLSVACTDRCTSTWSRLEHLTSKFKYRNNLLEYSICSASSWKTIVSRLINQRQRRAARHLLASRVMSMESKNVKKPAPSDLATAAKTATGTTTVKRVVGSESALERSESTFGGGTLGEGAPQQSEQKLLPLQQAANGPAAVNVNATHATAAAGHHQAPHSQVAIARRHAMDGIGLVERTIFLTSPEFIPTLDGQTLRQHVDKIVKLNLKTSPILTIDTRWQIYCGSLKINLALFPKAKLLFEILHNKGFKIVLTIKPYIDTSIGMGNLNQLLDARRLVTISEQSSRKSAESASASASASAMSGLDDGGTFDDGNATDGLQNSLWYRGRVLRRESFFKFKNETVTWLNKSPSLSRKHQQLLGRDSPYFFSCKESRDGHCALIDLTQAQNRHWFVDMIKRSSFLSQEADAIALAGAHPESRGQWTLAGGGGYRDAMAHLVNRLFYKENLYVIPQWTGNFNYVQLAPRSRHWDSLRSLVDSVLTLSMLGFSLVHPGSVWGDLKVTAASASASAAAAATAAAAAATDVANTDHQPLAGALFVDATTGAATEAAVTLGGLRTDFGQASRQRRRPGPASNVRTADEDAEDQAQRERRAEEELVVRWLQVAVFLPILQFNDLEPIYKYNLSDQVQQLVRLRRTFIGPEIKKNLPYTALLLPPPAAVAGSNLWTESTTLKRQPPHRGRRRRGRRRPTGPVPYQLPALRYTWASANLLLSGHHLHNSGQSSLEAASLQADAAIGQQFMIGPDMLVAPVLQDGQRQKDIYLPVGIWHDELRQTNIRGGKWLRNYPIELNEIAWFTRARR